jgi:hypothetical protein
VTGHHGIALKDGRADTAFHQLRDKAAVCAHYRFPAHSSVGIGWNDFTAAVEEAFNPHDAVTIITLSC